MIGPEWLVELVGKEFGKLLLDEYVFPIFRKDGKFSGKRLLIATFYVALGFLFYETPKLLLAIEDKWNFQSVYITNLHSHPYYKLSQFIFSSLYISMLLLAFSITQSKKRNEIEKLWAQNERIAAFANAVNLKAGSRYSNKEERMFILERIRDKIGESQQIRIMLINGTRDIVKHGATIKTAIEKKKEADLHLKVLLLDPLSSYAEDRAHALRPQTDKKLSRYSYICDFDRTIKQLEHYKSLGMDVDYRIYCSKPFFRFYLFDTDLFIQSYQGSKHGNETPMYHYEKGEDSMHHLGCEMFEYYWDKGFAFSDSSLKAMGDPFAYYLANMYKLDISGLNNDMNRIRQEILGYSKREITEANALHKDHRFIEA